MRKLGSDFDKLISEISEYFTQSGAKQMAPYMSSSIPKIENLIAVNHSGKRDLKKIKWIVIHSTESGSAKGTAQYFQNPKATGSTQFVVDDNSIFRTLPDNVEPWAAPGANSDGLHIELVGYAKWSREEWLKHQKTIKNAAMVISNWCSMYNITKQFVNAQGLLTGKSGITSHAEVSKAFKKSSHTDPGTGFPYDLLFSYLF